MCITPPCNVLNLPSSLTSPEHPTKPNPNPTKPNPLHNYSCIRQNRSRKLCRLWQSRARNPEHENSQRIACPLFNQKNVDDTHEECFTSVYSRVLVDGDPTWAKVWHFRLQNHRYWIQRNKTFFWLHVHHWVWRRWWEIQDGVVRRREILVLTNSVVQVPRYFASIHLSHTFLDIDAWPFQPQKTRRLHRIQPPAMLWNGNGTIKQR